MAAGVRFRPRRRRRPAAQVSASGFSAAAVRIVHARRRRVSSLLAVGRDDMSSNEGGVLNGFGRYLFISSRLLVAFSTSHPLKVPSPRAGSGRGGGPGDFPATLALFAPLCF